MHTRIISSSLQVILICQNVCVFQHGFARNMNWSVVDSDDVEGNPVVTLELKDGPYSRSMWDFSFQAIYKVSLCLATFNLHTETIPQRPAYDLSSNL